MSDEVRAAGGLLWRHGDAGVEVALVHRPRYDDWSLPKGKLRSGEEPVLGALRELLEETGMAGRAGRRLGTSAYDVLLHERWVPKTVDWWAVRSLGGTFEPGDEVDELRWCSPASARELLTAGRDVGPLDALVAGGWDLTTGVLVRHAVAGKRSEWTGDDDLRPLTGKGEAQAAALAEHLPAFGVTRVVSAPALRCVQTVVPVADRLGLTVEVEPLLGEDGHDEDPAGSLLRLRELLAQDGVVACSQGGAIPSLLDALAEASGLALGDTSTRKSAAWVLSLHKGALVAADLRRPPV